jgi:HPt (histidine-containing phosphotransfer) domain-containing protein
MILLLKNKKIIGVDKEFLNEVGAELGNISEIVNSIELNISSLKNKPLEINNKIFNVKKIEILTIEEIEVFDLTLQSSKETVPPIIPEIKLEEEIKPEIKPISEELTLEEIAPEIHKPEKEESFEEELLKIKPEIEIPKEIEPLKPESEPTISEFEIPKPEIELPHEELKPETEIPKEFEEIKSTQLPPKEKVDLTLQEQKEEQIQLVFEDDLAEVNEILELPKKEAKELINQEIKQAAKELGIDEEMTKELLNELYDQIENEKENFKKALENKDYDALHKIAHKLKGAALNLRLSKLAFILKTIDEKSKEHAPIATLKDLVNKFYDFFEKIKEKAVVIPEYLKETILQTIKTYLETQDEKKFQKDKKYIEKVLNTKIESIKDLEELIKDKK